MKKSAIVRLAVGCSSPVATAFSACGASTGESAPQSSDGLGHECQVTAPSQAVLPDAPADRLFGSASSHGNGELWVGGLGQNGVITADPLFVHDDGSVHWKLGWWRAVPGELLITGRRLDATAAPVRSEVPEGYGEAGFQASGVIFPTEGCWEVTGSVGTTTLTFVTQVVKTSSAESQP